ncbi:MAG TPA: ferrous iron transport protein A [Candidatus Bathyarchaeota archaeon]|nr:ferrous iron transport protein A [Candidatus Bathyarchaeota archaeon]
MELPLTELKNGETGVITSTDFRSEPKCMLGHRARRARWRGHFTVARFAKRLSDLGLTPGTKVTVVKSAPFNGPLEVNVRGSRLAIGRGMASRISVDVER